MLARDGAHNSLWQETTFDYQPASQRRTDQQFDVVIVGAGITGLTTALLLQEAGKKCVVLEAENIGYGTTGGTTAHLNTLLDTPYKTIIKNFSLEKAQLVSQAAKDAIALIQANVTRYQIDCEFELCKGYLFAQDEKQDQELDEIIRTTSEANVDIVEVNYIPIPVPFTAAAAVSGQAKFHPLRYLLSIAKAFENKGGVIIQHCRVADTTEANGKVTVGTTLGNIDTTHLIYATHIPPGINLVHLRCAPYRSYAMAVELTHNQYPSDLIYDMYDPYHYYRTQQIDGRNYLIVGGNDHKTGAEINTEAIFLNLEAHIRSHFKVGAVTQRWSSQYYEPADGLPYIGVFPGHASNVLVATGYGGNGMTYSAIAAMVLSSLVFEKEDPLTDLFSPGRIKPIAGFQNFVSHNADVVKELFKKLKPTERLEGFADIAPGEGRIVKIDGHTLGLYKDEESHLHAVSATCTHMGCTVHWNGAEKSWDCPCHGARYSVDGKVLNGPTDEDLTYENLSPAITAHTQ